MDVHHTTYTKRAVVRRLPDSIPPHGYVLDAFRRIFRLRQPPAVRRIDAANSISMSLTVVYNTSKKTIILDSLTNHIDVVYRIPCTRT